MWLWLTEMVVACVRCLLILIAACVVSGWSWLWVVAVRPVCCLVELAVSQLTRKTWAFLARAMMRYEMGSVIVGVMQMLLVAAAVLATAGEAATRFSAASFPWSLTAPCHPRLAHHADLESRCSVCQAESWSSQDAQGEVSFPPVRLSLYPGPHH